MQSPVDDARQAPKKAPFWRHLIDEFVLDGVLTAALMAAIALLWLVHQTILAFVPAPAVSTTRGIVLFAALLAVVVWLVRRRY